VQSSAGSAYNKISVLVSEPSDDSPDTEYADIRVNMRGGSKQTLKDDHRANDALCFVLLFPGGDDGYRRELQPVPKNSVCGVPCVNTSLPTDQAVDGDCDLDVDDNEQDCDDPGRKTRGRNHIGPNGYYAYRLHWRCDATGTHDASNSLLCSGRLFQEYCCAVWARAESMRLSWQRNNQTTLRAHKYKQLQDHVHANDGAAAGQRIILASSFVGGPRDMHQRYQDAMAVVQELGKPSLFITFTCNPKWPEIVESCPPGVLPLRAAQTAFTACTGVPASAVHTA
jgi:hypothetical protein